MELSQEVFMSNAGSGRDPMRPLPGLLLSGAGQCAESAFALTLALGEGRKPALIALYECLYDTGYFPNPTVMEAPHLFPGAILQIGLQLPLFHREGLLGIAEGRADAEISRMAARYASLPCHILLRIGYEFDGDAWNGYEPAAYRAAYRRIAHGLENAQNVALVWDSYTTDTENVMDWYPGDDVVDWFGYNTMSPKFDCQRMAALAAAHGKPLLNGEASYAMDAGGWPFSRWARAFFDSMRENDVQAYQYINWRWQVYPRSANWHSWEDGRITGAPDRMAAYLSAMEGPGLVVRGTGYAQPFKLAVDCGRALAEGVPPAPWRPEHDHVSALPGYSLRVRGAKTVYGNGWMGGWTGGRMTIQAMTPADFSGALLLKPLAAEPVTLFLNGEKAVWQPGDGYLRLHHWQPGDGGVIVSGADGKEAGLDLVALLAYAGELPSVTGLAFRAGKLTWTGVEGAACYCVYACGSLIGYTAGTSFPLRFPATRAAVSAFDPHLGEGRPAQLLMEEFRHE